MPTSAKHADLGVEIGQVFLGKYRVDAILGQGGMGVVAQCHHLQLDERVAIKMLRPDVLSDQDAVQRFIREAQAAAKLKSEYVARVSDVGSFETGVPYMVMEFLDGLDLGQMLEDGKKTIGVPLAVELGLQACEALCEAHSLGIVHRDVKPTNLFVIWRADKPQVKVLDFGISKSASATDLKLTQTQSLLGTPAYMSPEQMRSAREVDSRTDIWSLGTVLYEAIEGRRPFEAESFSEMVVKVSMEPPTPMRNAPIALQQVILRCLCKQPDQRFSTMADLGRELIPFAQDPHAAQMLVERMHRILRRSQAHAGDWESPQTGAGQRVPTASHDIGSAPMRSGMVQAQAQLGVPTPAPGAVQQPMMHAPSQPVATPWAGGSQVSGEPWHGLQGTDPSAPAVYESRPFVRQPAGPEMRSQPTAMVDAQKRPVPVALLVGVFAFAIVMGVVFAVALKGNDPSTPAPTSEDKAPTTQPAQPQPPPTQPTQPTQPIQVVIPTAGSGSAATPSVEGAGTGSAGSAGDDVQIDTPPKLNPPHGGVGRNNGGSHGGLGRTNGGSHGGTTVKTTTTQQQTGATGGSAQTTTTTPTTTPDPDQTQPGMTKCWNGEPVDHYMHGCPPKT
nr:serine/threonine-protein kinase [Kofleriaceae bacterium]